MPRAKGKSGPVRKDTKLQLRLSPAEKELIARAARLRKTTVSGFLLDNARTAAEQVLADRVHFLLPPDQWEAFCKALDAPPGDMPALKRLLSDPSVFDVAARPAARSTKL